MNFDHRGQRWSGHVHGKRHEATFSEKIYPFRHCLMITGGVLIVLDLGLFIGGIAIIASKIDMDTYGFAAMVGFAVITMVLACLALVCGCRAESPRSSKYEAKPVHVVKMPPSPKKSPMPPRISNPQTGKPQVMNGHQQRTVVFASQNGVPKVEAPLQRPAWQRSSMQRVKESSSSSEWSRDATYGGSSDALETEVPKRFLPPQRQHKKRITHI